MAQAAGFTPFGIELSEKRGTFFCDEEVIEKPRCLQRGPREEFP